MRVFLLIYLMCSGLQAAEALSTNLQSFVIGISPFLDKTVKDDVYRGIIRLLVQDLPLNSSVALYDAYHLRTITRVTLPKAAAFESPKTRANQFASAIGELKQFLAAEPPRPKAARLSFDGSLRLPQFCDFLAENYPAEATPAVLLIGSPLYQDPKEPDFSMTDGYFPADGHLQVSREKSIFGLSNRAGPAFLVHWVYFGDPWASDLYKEKVTRFWTLYVERRGSHLITFCGDLPTALLAFRHGSSSAALPVTHWTLDPQQTKVEMLRIGREVELADWIQRESVSDSPQHAPSVMFGPMKLGIRWKDNIDLDLYATPRTGAETLFFQHPRSSDGFYYKDHRSSPGREYEFIEFASVDARQVEAYVNFYKGDCRNGPRGEVRIEFDGRIYSAPFSIEASEGNRGRSGPGQEQFWQKIPVQEILRISRAE
ncbi:MAG TPA: hypothetical protein VL793_09475 [Patescibacteria group bacterium]|nr:hypothetical protein [Patescibacteria group bacterium]